MWNESNRDGGEGADLPARAREPAVNNQPLAPNAANEALGCVWPFCGLSWLVVRKNMVRSFLGAGTANQKVGGSGRDWGDRQRQNGLCKQELNQ